MQSTRDRDWPIERTRHRAARGHMDRGGSSESTGNRAALSNRDLCQEAALPGLLWEGHLAPLLASLCFLQVDL